VAYGIRCFESESAPDGGAQAAPLLWLRIRIGPDRRRRRWRGDASVWVRPGCGPSDGSPRWGRGRAPRRMRVQSKDVSADDVALIRSQSKGFRQDPGSAGADRLSEHRTAAATLKRNGLRRRPSNATLVAGAHRTQRTSPDDLQTRRCGSALRAKDPKNSPSDNPVRIGSQSKGSREQWARAPPEP